MKLMRVATICLFVTSLASSACVPDPLEGFDDTGTPSNNPNSMTDMGTVPDTGTTPGAFTAEFQAVTAILRPNCLLGGCHGNPPGAASVFLVPTGTNATDAEIQTALSNTIPAPSGNRLVTGGNSATSEIYLRITKMPGDLQLMGAGQYGAAATPLAPAQISAIETWIANGALYTQ